MYNEVMVSIDAVNIDYEYKALNVVICTEWTFSAVIEVRKYCLN